MYIISHNPFTNEEYKTKQDSKSAIKEKLSQAGRAQKDWSNLSIAQRAKHITKLANALEKHKNHLAKIAAEDMGKPIQQGIAEVEKCSRSLKYYANNAKTFLKNLEIETEAKKSYISYQPLGVVLAIMPWNFPYWQVYRALGPILMSGNTMLLKHASNVMRCAVAMQQIADDINLPKGVFGILKVKSDVMSEIIANEAVNAITFTGSSEAGAQVAAIAARHLKKQVLELGGSDPYIILEDADLDKAIPLCTHSRLNNTGQSCIAAKRFIVHKKIVGKFRKMLKQSFEEMKYGDPLDENNDLGTIARKDLRDQLHLQVQKSIRKGAVLDLGGFIPKGDSALYPPTILSKVKKGMPAYDEELFGPVAAIIEVDNEDQALAIANDSIYGLGGAVFSKNIAKAKEMAEEKIHSGFVCVNDYVSSDPRLPFGGVKQSGYGRELSHLGIQEFCNIKTIYVK